MDSSDGPHMVRTQPPPSATAIAGEAFSALGSFPGSAIIPWPQGPWDFSAAPLSLPGGPAHRGIYLHEDLYPDSCGVTMSSLGGEVAGDMVLPALSAFPTYQQYTVQSDSLLPDDAYVYPPPNYPLYNWTLPYGPERILPSAMPLPSPSSNPATQLPPTRPRSLRQSAPTPAPAPAPATNILGQPPGIRVQFKGPSEIRQTLHGDAGVFSAAGIGVAQCPNLSTECIDLEDDDVVEVEVRTCRPDDAPSSERVTFDSIEDALASIEAQDQMEKLSQLAQQQQKQQQQQVVNGDVHLQTAPGYAIADAHAGVAAAVATRTRRLSLADEKQEEVIKAARSLFSKRTRTLYHWLYPDTSKTKLKSTVSAAWDTLAESEKEFYLSQVLGRFGLQASSLMVNPQLDGIKGLPVPELGPSWAGVAAAGAAVATVAAGTAMRAAGTPMRAAGTPMRAAGTAAENSPPAHRGPSVVQTRIFNASGITRGGGGSRPASPRLTEAQEAVNQLFASCADSETWASFSMSASSATADADGVLPEAAPRPSHTSSTASRTTSRAHTLCGHPEKRKRLALEGGPGARLNALGADQVDDEVTILKQMRDARLETELEGDVELRSELEKFRLLANTNERSTSCKDGDDFWRRTPDPDEIFAPLNF